MNPIRIPSAAAIALFLLVPSISLADPVHVKGDAPLTISHGETIKLEDYLVPGKTTVFDFYSQYCPPCRALSPHMEKLHHDRPDVAVVEIDINQPGVKGIDWQSPVARQFGLQSIPDLRVYGPDGKLVADGDAARDLVTGWMQD